MYGENPVFPSLIIRPERDPAVPELPNVKGAVFQVTSPFSLAAAAAAAAAAAELFFVSSFPSNFPPFLSHL